MVCESSGEAMRRWVWVAGVALVVMSAGCSSAHHRAATPVTAPPTTAPGPDPYVIPAVITPAYVDAVFKVLENIAGDVSRQLVAQDAVTPGVLADLRAIFNDPLYATEVSAIHDVLANIQDLRHPPGNVVTVVTRLISASPTCIFASTKSNGSAVTVSSGPAIASEYWELRPKQPDDDPSHINPTPWAFSFNAEYLTPTVVPNQCDT